MLNQAQKVKSPFMDTRIITFSGNENNASIGNENNLPVASDGVASSGNENN